MTQTEGSSQVWVQPETYISYLKCAEEAGYAGKGHRNFLDYAECHGITLPVSVVRDALDRADMAESGATAAYAHSEASTPRGQPFDTEQATQAKAVDFGERYPVIATVRSQDGRGAYPKNEAGRKLTASSSGRHITTSIFPAVTPQELADFTAARIPALVTIVRIPNSETGALIYHTTGYCDDKGYPRVSMAIPFPDARALAEAVKTIRTHPESLAITFNNLCRGVATSQTEVAHAQPPFETWDRIGVRMQGTAVEATTVFPVNHPSAGPQTPQS